MIDVRIKSVLNAVLAGSRLAEEAVGNQILGRKGNLRDIVTQADIDICELLRKKLEVTGIPVVSEEGSALEDKTPEVFWVVDPIDGTVNYLNGLPIFTVSVGLVDRGEYSLGAVCAPGLNELYFTLNSSRALMNGRSFEHQHSNVEDGLVSATFPAKADQTFYDLFREVNEFTCGCLRTGSASLNICWAASGKLQAAYGFEAKLWDVAGAIAIAKSAGCEVVVRRKPNSLIIDYFVGSKKMVGKITEAAKNRGLFN
jgi:myo-inositol-1(or 4)-monophosphatase